MKKITLFSVILILALLTGCSNGSPTETEAGNFTVAAMKGPTGMGIAKLMEDNETGKTMNKYQFTITGTADEISVGLLNGAVDIAAVPCNLASALYNNSQGKIKVAAVNTLGVLYVLEKGDQISQLSDLKGQTLYTAGKGATPEYSLRHILMKNGIDPDNDVTIEFRSEASEVAALFAAGQIDIAMLPQPYVTSVLENNPDIRIALDLNELWDETGGSSRLVTGVVVARAETIADNPAAFDHFLTEYEDSVHYVNAHTAEAALLIEQFDIAQAAIAEKAIPYCNMVFITESEMEEAVSGYLQALYEMNPQSIGGTVPDEDFYYKK